MGRKKTRRSSVKKSTPMKKKLDKVFPCPFCNKEGAIECKLDRNRRIGTANCRECEAGYQTVINYLTEPIDVYSEWLDAIEAQSSKKKE